LNDSVSDVRDVARERMMLKK